MINVKSFIEESTGTTIKESDDLIELGILDSLAIINLLSYLEDMGLDVSITRIDKNIFKNINSLQEYVNELEKK